MKQKIFFSNDDLTRLIIRHLQEEGYLSFKEDKLVETSEPWITFRWVASSMTKEVSVEVTLPEKDQE